MINNENGKIKISIIGIGRDDPDARMDDKAEAKNEIEMGILIKEILDRAKKET